MEQFPSGPELKWFEPRTCEAPFRESVTGPVRGSDVGGRPGEAGTDAVGQGQKQRQGRRPLQTLGTDPRERGIGVGLPGDDGKWCQGQPQGNGHNCN